MRTQTVVHRTPEPVHTTESPCVVCDTHVDKKRRSATPVCWARPAPGPPVGPLTRGLGHIRAIILIILILQSGDPETYKVPLVGPRPPSRSVLGSRPELEGSDSEAPRWDLCL